MLALLLLACAGGTPDDTPRDDTDTPEDTAPDTDCAPSTWFADRDGDGFGDDATAVDACEAPEGHVAEGGDCDDADGAVNPDAAEVCDAADADEDCDGYADDRDPDVTGEARWYEDADGDGFGATATTRCEAPADHVAEGGDCDDADGAVYPHAPDVCGDGIDADCQGADPDCRLSGELPVESADVLLVGGDSSVQLGVRIGVGDTDGDGAADLVLGTRRMGTTREYGVYVFAGPLTGAPTPADARLALATGTQVDTGAFIEGLLVADLDGDAVAELVVANYNGDLGPGAVRIYDASGGSLTPADARATLAGTTGDQLGKTLAAGDLDGDGLPDLVAGAPAEDGAVYVFADPFGAEAGTDGLRIAGDTDARTGLSVAVPGDLDGDGVDDLVVLSDEDRCDGDPGCAVVHVFSGPVGAAALDDADATVETWLWSGSPTGVHAAGDVDDDGLADLWITDSAGREYGNNSLLQGAAYLFEGPLSGVKAVDDADAILYGSGDDHAGNTLSGGDVDRDGHADVLVGMDSSNDGSLKQAFLFYGPLSGERSVDDAATTFGLGDEDDFAAQLALGDVTGDAAMDAILASPDHEAAETQEGLVHVWAGQVSD